MQASTWISLVSGAVLVLGLIAWVRTIKRYLAEDARNHAQAKKSPLHLSSYEEPSSDPSSSAPTAVSVPPLVTPLPPLPPPQQPPS